MQHAYSLTEAKAKLSDIVNRVHFKNETFTITKKGKAVAVISPIRDLSELNGKGEGLILAKGALSDKDCFIDEMLEDIYQKRMDETDRMVDL
jgi:prevent-host-death family protein